MLKKLTDSEIKTSLQENPGWDITEKQEISKTFKFQDFPQAILFTNTVAFLAEKANHHPDILIRWNQVFLTLITHDSSGLTEKDFKLACQIDKIHKQI